MEGTRLDEIGMTRARARRPITHRRSMRGFIPGVCTPRVAAFQADKLPETMKRQRLLYLSAVSRSIRAAVVGFAIHEPVVSGSPQVEVGAEVPYQTVHDAILDGWRVVHFPDQRLDLDPERVGTFGFEFILEQMVETDD